MERASRIDAAVSCTNVRHHSVVMATPDRVTNGPRRRHGIVETTGGLQQQQRRRRVADAAVVRYYR